jgi:hypothetical protein
VVIVSHRVIMRPACKEMFHVKHSLDFQAPIRGPGTRKIGDMFHVKHLASHPVSTRDEDVSRETLL